MTETSYSGPENMHTLVLCSLVHYLLPNDPFQEHILVTCQ